MRERFLLALRVIGVLLLLAGLLLVFQAILLLIMGITSPEVPAATRSWDPALDAAFKPLKDIARHMDLWLFLFPVINGFLLMILGGYLVRSRTPVFLNACYPVAAAASQVRTEGDGGRTTPLSSPTKTDEQRFMPRA